MLKAIQSPKTLPAQHLSSRSLIETQDGITLYFQDWGTGKPVVFVHGWVLGAEMWEYQMTNLSTRDFVVLRMTNVGVVAPANRVTVTILIPLQTTSQP